MSEEELKAKIAELEKENKQLKDNVSKQNSYITKLEGKANNSEPAPSVNSALNPAISAYLEKNMRRDVIEEASAEIKKTIPEDKFKAVEPDFKAFLDKNMTSANCTTAYAIDAFALVYGRAAANPEHAINKLGKGSTSTATPITATNSTGVQSVQNTIIQTTPPVMGNKDASAVSGIPESQGTPVSNTRDAFKNLKSRFANLGGNKFN